MTVEVWKHRGDAIVYEPATNDWVSRVLGMPAQLVYMPDDVQRPVSPSRGREGDMVSFADGYPVSRRDASTSLDDLNGRLRGRPSRCRRFPPETS